MKTKRQDKDTKTAAKDNAPKEEDDDEAGDHARTQQSRSSTLWISRVSEGMEKGVRREECKIQISGKEPAC